MESPSREAIMSNPHYPPEVQAECTLINFTVTEQGLEDQLLNLVVEKERPDLAKQRTDLIVQQNENKIKLVELEKSLLEALTSATGDILENVTLLENLDYTKKIAIEIEEKVKVRKETQSKIKEASENYRPVAARGSLLVFLLRQTELIAFAERTQWVAEVGAQFRSGQRGRPSPPTLSNRQ